MFAAFLTASLLQGSVPPAVPQTPGPIHDASPWLRITAWLQGTAPLRSEWATFGHGPSHTGYFPDVLLPGGFTPGWTATLAGNLQQVAVADGRVYATPWQYFGNAWLAALDENTGDPLWSYTFNQCYSINPPTFDSGKVYVQRGDHGSDTHLWSFHADTGLPFWVSPHAAQWERYMAPAVANGKVWVNGGYYGGMYGFQQSDGTQLFFQGLEQYDGWTPSFHADRIYSWVAGILRAHHQVTGALLWSLDLGWNWAGWTMGRTSAIANGRLYVVGNPNLYAIDLSSHALAWSVNGDFTGTPAVANGVVYALSGGFVKAYDAWDGHYLGVYPGEPGLMDQPIVTDDALVFASATRTYVYDRATFQAAPAIPYGGHLSFANRRLYIATSAGELRTYDNPASPNPAANLVAEWEPWIPASGNQPRTSRIAITNYGALDAPTCRVSLFLSTDTVLDGADTLLRNVSIAPLAVGQKLSATVLIANNPALTGKYLLAVPDETSAVPETNEDNVSPSGRIP